MIGQHIVSKRFAPGGVPETMRFETKEAAVGYVERARDRYFEVFYVGVRP